MIYESNYYNSSYIILAEASTSVQNTIKYFNIEATKDPASTDSNTETNTDAASSAAGRSMDTGRSQGLATGANAEPAPRGGQPGGGSSGLAY